MDTTWLIIILIIIAEVALIVFLIMQDRRDVKEFTQKLIDEDVVQRSSEHNTELV